MMFVDAAFMTSSTAQPVGQSDPAGADFVWVVKDVFTIQHITE